MKRKNKENLLSKRNMSLFIIAIMVLSSFAVIFYGFTEGSGEVKEGTVTFKSAGNFWTAKINGKELEFDFLPSEVANVNISEESMQFLKNKVQIDVTTDPNSTAIKGIALAQYRMGQSLPVANSFIRMGSLYENEYNFPVITCETASEAVPVIYFKDAELSRVYKEGNCIIAEGANDLDFVAIGHKIIYSILGVGKNG